MKIGDVEIERTAMLAPMAGVTDRAFRELCREFGAAYAVGEMVSAKGLTMGSKKSGRMLLLGEDEHPGGMQIFGAEPAAMAEAARMAEACGADIVDINMGCPAPKIAGGGGGCALMRTPELAEAIIRAAVSAVEKPVTVKFRKGWDASQVNAVEFARMAERAGAAAVCVHGRTREQMYAPSADWEIIRRVKEAVAIPVIGNGDVDSPEKAAGMYEATGCDLVAVGRGAMGNPWLFRQIAQYLAEGRYDVPTPEERMAVMLKHIERMAEYKGEAVALREARKHCGWYLKGMRGAAALRRRADTLTTLDDLRALARAALGDPPIE